MRPGELMVGLSLGYGLGSGLGSTRAELCLVKFMQLAEAEACVLAQMVYSSVYYSNVSRIANYF